MNNETSVPFIRIAEAIEYLYDHFQTQPSLNEVAAKIGVSPAHFQRQFQDWAGISPKKMLQFISIEHAKTVLQAQGSVQNAAFESGGLSGSSRLHDLFVSIEGMTPGEYKNGGAGLTVDYAFAPTAFGDVLIAATPKGICWLAFADDRRQSLQDLQHEYPQANFRQHSNILHEQALSALGGNATAPLPLHLKGTPFQLKVWQALLSIPAGKLSSYGELAAQIGKPTAARAVGTAIGHNPVAVLIPCHRVIRESGIIGGYRWQRGRKMALLAKELGAKELGENERGTMQ